MGVYHGNDLKKPSGGKKGKHVKVKRKYWIGRYPLNPVIGEERRKVVRTKGGGVKVKLAKITYANIAIPGEGKVVKTKVLKLVSNPTSRDLERRGIITKGAIISTELGLARVTSRPGQDGVVNAILIESS